MSLVIRSLLNGTEADYESYNTCAAGTTKEECELYCKSNCVQMNQSKGVRFNPFNETKESKSY